ncbi:MAG: DUF4340 domain-containing protein [Pseudomonadales bacterium]
MFRGSYYFLFALIAVLLLGLLLGGGDGAGDSSKTLPLLPEEVAARLDALTTVSISGPASSVTLQRQEDRWVVVERANYVANQQQVQRLLRDLRDARRLEEKTRKPENFARLGVAANGIQLAIADTTLLFGQQASGRGGRYVRYLNTDDENQVWLQSAPLSQLAVDPAVWLQPNVIDIESTNVQRVAILQGEESLQVERTTTGEVLVVGVAEEQLRYAGIADSVLNLLSGVKLEDVLPRGELDFDGAIEVSVTLTDDAKVDLRLLEHDGAFWLAVDSERAEDKYLQSWVFKISRLNYDNMTKTKSSLLKAEDNDL